MATNSNIERLARQKNAVVEVHLSPWPDPPASLMSFAGMKEWWAHMKLCRERDQEMLYKMALTKQDE